MHSRPQPAASRCSARRRPERGYPGLDTAEQAFARLASDPAAPRVRTALGVLPLEALRPVLTDPSTPPGVVDGVWRTLAGQARAEGGTWILAAVGCALPKLRAAARHATLNPEVDRDEVASAVLAAFTDTLLTLDPLPRAGVLNELARPAHNAAQRVADHHRRVRRTHARLSASIAPPPPPGHPDFVLAGLVRDGVIDRDEAELIGLHRIEGVSLRRIAAARGWYPMKAQRALREAERRVINALLTEQ
jgi:hypothetical protein